MRTWILCASIFAVCGWSFAAEEWTAPPGQNLLPLLDLPKNEMSASLRQAVETLKASKVTSPDEARKAVLGFADDKPAYMRGARMHLKVTGLHRVGREVADFASSPDYMWVVHAEMPSGVMQVFYVSASTGKVFTLFSDTPRKTSIRLGMWEGCLCGGLDHFRTYAQLQADADKRISFSTNVTVEANQAKAKPLTFLKQHLHDSKLKERADFYWLGIVYRRSADGKTYSALHRGTLSGLRMGEMKDGDLIVYYPESW